MGLLCACLVVFIHVKMEVTRGDFAWWVQQLFAEGLCRLAVPFFFVASGYFLSGHAGEPGWWPRELRKRLSSLLVPYLFWCLLFAGVSCAFSVVGGANTGLEEKLTLAWWAEALGFTVQTPGLFPLWFVRNLLLLVMVSPLLVTLTATRLRAGLTLLGCVALYFGLTPAIYSGATWALPWGMLFSMEGLTYFTLGLALRRHPLNLRLPKPLGALLLLAGVGLFVLSVQAGLDVKPWWWVPRLVAIPLALWGLWALIPATPLPRSFTSLAFPIYLLHFFVLFALWLLLARLAPNTLTCSAYYMLAGCIAITLSAQATLLFRRLFPRLANFLFGGR